MVQNLLVNSPNFVPLHVDSVSRWTLFQHECFESLSCHTSAHDALNGWESRIVPPIDMVVLNEPLQFTLGKACAQKI